MRLKSLILLAFCYGERLDPNGNPNIICEIGKIVCQAITHPIEYREPLVLVVGHHHLQQHNRVLAVLIAQFLDHL